MYPRRLLYFKHPWRWIARKAGIESLDRSTLCSFSPEAHLHLREKTRPSSFFPVRLWYIHRIYSFAVQASRRLSEDYGRRKTQAQRYLECRRERLRSSDEPGWSGDRSHVKGLPGMDGRKRQSDIAVTPTDSSLRMCCSALNLFANPAKKYNCSSMNFTIEAAWDKL